MYNSILYLITAGTLKNGIHPPQKNGIQPCGQEMPLLLYHSFLPPRPTLQDLVMAAQSLPEHSPVGRLYQPFASVC